MTEVKTDIYVTSFGPVSDVEMVRIRPPLCSLKPKLPLNSGCNARVSHPLFLPLACPYFAGFITVASEWTVVTADYSL